MASCYVNRSELAAWELRMYDGPFRRISNHSTVIRGDVSLFTSRENVEAAWRIIDPILGDSAPIAEYEPGTWGPAAAAKIVAGVEGWHDPEPEASKPC